MKSIIEFIIMMVLGVIYFKIILPYYVNDFNNDFKHDFKDDFKHDFKKNLANDKEEFIKNCTNKTSYSNEGIIIDKINYTNNNIYIQI